MIASSFFHLSLALTAVTAVSAIITAPDVLPHIQYHTDSSNSNRDVIRFDAFTVTADHNANTATALLHLMNADDSSDANSGCAYDREISVDNYALCINSSSIGVCSNGISPTTSTVVDATAISFLQWDYPVVNNVDFLGGESTKQFRL